MQQNEVNPSRLENNSATKSAQWNLKITVLSNADLLFLNYLLFLFKIKKKADTVLNFSSDLAMKTYKFKSVDEKLPELETRVSHSFDIKLVSRTKTFEIFGVPSSPLPVKFFCFKISFCGWDITNFFSVAI